MLVPASWKPNTDQEPDNDIESALTIGSDASGALSDASGALTSGTGTPERQMMDPEASRPRKSTALV
jgi:hypothetical protein